ncbi:hypothetical protein AC628_28405 [Bradyrhizobium sp. NAS96.2]|nr:hypothetical protein AC628_28405 [Bradyrhizobium sp. NAS96.2]
MCLRAAIANRVVVMVLSAYFGMLDANSASQEYLCQLGAGFINNGASCLSIQVMPFLMVDQLVQTSALLADS